MNNERYKTALQSIDDAANIRRLGELSRAVEERIVEGAFSEVEGLVLLGLITRKCFRLGGIKEPAKCSRKKM